MSRSFVCRCKVTENHLTCHVELGSASQKGFEIPDQVRNDDNMVQHNDKQMIEIADQVQDDGDGSLPDRMLNPPTADQHDGEIEHVWNDDSDGINIMKKPLKVGFDFDGVILYNPARVLRPFLGYLRGKKKKNGTTTLYFFHPKSKIQQFFWLLAHQTSLFPSPGLDEVRSLVASRSIEAYIITGRSSFLRKDFDRRLRSIGAEKFIKKACLSEIDEQPHEYKERMIKELKLDCYVEDNWNIAQYLSQHTKARIFWITNAADDHIEYQDKYHRFDEVVEEIKKMVS